MLPVTVHTQAMSRLSTSELVQFESLLSTADDTLDACMRARTEPSRNSDDDSSKALFQVAIDTISALTNAPLPGSLSSKTDVVNWISRSVLEMRNREVELATRTNGTVGMNPAAVAVCMELITKLNTAIGGDHLS